MKCKYCSSDKIAEGWTHLCQDCANLLSKFNRMKKQDKMMFIMSALRKETL